jgi:hypothetical protein
MLTRLSQGVLAMSGSTTFVVATRAVPMPSTFASVQTLTVVETFPARTAVLGAFASHNRFLSIENST